MLEKVGIVIDELLIIKGIYLFEIGVKSFEMLFVMLLYFIVVFVCNDEIVVGMLFGVWMKGVDVF